MNPIENVWVDMVRDLDGRSAKSTDEIFEKVNQETANIFQICLNPW